MSTLLAASTDLTFVARRRPPVPVPGADSPRSPGPSRWREQRAGVWVELGASWRAGDAEVLLAGISRAIALGAPFTLCHRGAGGMSLVRAAALEQPHLRVRERIRGGDGGLHKQPPPHWRRCALTAGRTEEDGAVAITGGLGGIGLRLATQLAESGRSIWLLDRQAVSGLPVSAQQVLGRLASRTRVVVGQLDVRTGCGRPPFPISHLVHAAGELDLLPVAELDAGRLERYAVAKAAGLRRCTEDLLATGLRSVVVFGSVESRRPHRGFGSYALANELVRLEADRLRDRYPRLGVCTAEWSLWSDVGMAADAARFAGLAGFAVVPADWGAQAGAALLARGGELPAELALGGPQSDAEQPVRAIAGIGGSSHSLQPRSVQRLVSLCRPSRPRARAGEWVAAPRDSDSAPVLRAVVRGRRIGTWASTPASWEPVTGGGR